MKRNVCIICSLLMLLVLHYGCNEDSPRIIKDKNGFQLTMDGSVTRSQENEAILDNMRLYCFSQGGTSLSGDGGSWDSHFDHQLLGVTRTDMTLHANAVRTGDWDLVMVSAAGAELTPPISSRKSSEALMYTYKPGTVQANGSKNKAHEIWHRMLRLERIKTDEKTVASCTFTRNAAMIRVVVARAVDIDLAPTAEHKFELHGVPDKISWSGTLLKTISPGEYETSLDNPDVLAEPLTGKFTFVDNSANESGTYKSDTLTFIVPAHREEDFWLNNLTPNPNVQDTLEHKMSLSVSFTRKSGGTFTKTVGIDRTIRCNGILLLNLRMKDVNLELTTSVKSWETEKVPGDFEAPYLNVSDVETTVYDGAASRIYFWSNQPDEDVYVLNEGEVDGGTNVDAIFDRIAGPTAVNRYYDVAKQSGYIDISCLTLDNFQADAKIYLKAGSLRREITVKRSVSQQARKKITTPYVGTFHRADQVGERIVTWSYDKPWTAYVEGPAAAHVIIDRLPSPSFSDGSLYGASPSDAEMGIMSNDVTKVTGRNTIYFRVGWASRISSADDPRYATIIVREGTNNPSGTVIQTLYLRQGEKASAVYFSGRTNPARFSPYNLTTAAGSGPVGVRGGIPTDYPSQCGSYFQWMDPGNARYAYATFGDPGTWNYAHPFYETYWTEDNQNMGDTYETCPNGYRRVSDGATDKEVFDANGNLIGTSELRQSLWANPTAANGATNTLSGYYADGFFDRRSIIDSENSAAYSAAGTGKDVAYKGRLFFNNTTKASLFFPAAGQRVQATGKLDATGVKGYYWTASSTLRTTEPTGANAYISTRLRNTAVNIRCVAE